MNKMFRVIDLETGQEADLERIAIESNWASLAWPDIDGFALTEHGDLILLDECGNYVGCPAYRFKIAALDLERSRGCGKEKSSQSSS